MTPLYNAHCAQAIPPPVSGHVTTALASGHRQPGREAGRRGSQPLRAAAVTELRGHDLACWCQDQPCHADVLLELANP